MISAESNTYSYAADAARAQWAAHVGGSREAAVCVLSGAVLSDEARAALDASFERLGYGPAACTFVALTAGEGGTGGEALSAADAYTLLESLDPMVLVAADSAAAAALSQIYRADVVLEKPARLMGRDAVAFADFAGMLTDPAAKRRAWTTLKQLTR